MTKVALTSLGCTRNLVDSEVILGSLKKAGYGITDIEKGADILIINTCAFIGPARTESIEEIMSAAQLKKEGKVRHIVLCGCLPQLYKKGLLKELPEVDLIVGTSDFPRLADMLKKLGAVVQSSAVTDSKRYLYDDHSPRKTLTPPHYAYVKVSEGCDNLCSYCIISRLRGRLRSRAIGSVVKEIETLSRGGKLKEINLVGQDTTSFGVDRYGKPRFDELLRKICGLKNSVRWVRLMYTHPAHYTEELIRTICDEEKICKYLDLPIQHISDHILKAMNRQTTQRDIVEMVEGLRTSIPNLILRTSIIVGFPGETDKDFKDLLEFIGQTGFERLGAFIYSPEEGTKAGRAKDQVPEDLKRERYDELMKLQQRISADSLKRFVGRSLDVLVDERLEDKSAAFIGRTYADAPEVDGVVYLKGRGLKIGQFCRAKIVDTLEYDLIGETVA